MRVSFVPDNEGFYRPEGGLLVLDPGRRPYNCDRGGFFISDKNTQAIIAMDGLGRDSGPTVQAAVEKFGELFETAPSEPDAIGAWVNTVRVELSNILSGANHAATLAFAFEMNGGFCVARVGDARWLIADPNGHRASVDQNEATEDFLSQEAPQDNTGLAQHLQKKKTPTCRLPLWEAALLRRLATPLPEALMAELASFGPEGHRSYVLPDHPENLSWQFIPAEEGVYVAVMSDGISVSNSMRKLASQFHGGVDAPIDFLKARWQELHHNHWRIPFHLPGGHILRVTCGPDNRVLVAAKMGGWRSAID